MFRYLVVLAVLAAVCLAEEKPAEEKPAEKAEEKAPEGVKCADGVCKISDSRAFRSKYGRKNPEGWNCNRRKKLCEKGIPEPLIVQGKGEYQIPMLRNAPEGWTCSGLVIRKCTKDEKAAAGYMEQYDMFDDYNMNMDPYGYY